MTKEERINAEILRTKEAQAFEYSFSDGVICGIDEAGRGPLCGPVVAGAVILPRNNDFLFINDSKKLSEKKRDELYELISKNAISWAVGIVDEKDIDEMNILQATYKAMRIAVNSLTVTPDILLNDAVIIPGLSFLQEKIIKGDAKCQSIAAASIMAKVTRDRLMAEYDEMYPQYGFLKNKGYGTAEHIKAIKEYGPCPIHRKTFIKNFV